MCGRSYFQSHPLNEIAFEYTSKRIADKLCDVPAASVDNNVLDDVNRIKNAAFRNRSGVFIHSTRQTSSNDYLIT